MTQQSPAVHALPKGARRKTARIAMEQQDALLANDLGILTIRATARLVIGLAVALVTALVPAVVAAAAGRFNSQRTLDALGPETAPLAMFVKAFQRTLVPRVGELER